MKKSTGIALVSATAASILLTGCGEAGKIEKYLNDGDYSEAVELYENSSLSDKEREKIAKNMRARLEKTVKDYAADTTGYKTARRTVTAIIEMEIASVSDEAAAALSKLDELNESKESYKSAEDHYKEGRLLEAFRAYSKVIEDDCNYADASEKAGRLADEYYEQVKKEAEEKIDENDYKSAIRAVNESVSLWETEKLIKYFEQIKKEYLSLIERDVKAALEDEKYDDAANIIYGVDRDNFWDQAETEKLAGLLDSVHEAKQYAYYVQYRDQYFESLDSYLESNDFYYAYYYLDRARNYNEDFALNDDVFIAKEKELDMAFEEYIFAITDRFAAAEDHLGVMEALEDAIGIRELESFKALYETTSLKCPVYLSMLEDLSYNSYVKKGNYKNEDYVTPLENVYPSSGSSFVMNSSAGGSWSSASTASIEVTLNGQYKTISGLLDTLDANVTGPAEDESGEDDQVASMSAENGGEDGEGTDEEAEDGNGNAVSVEPAESVEKDGYTSDEKGTFYILGEDGESVLYQKTITGATIPSEVSVDISGLDKITLKFTAEQGSISALLYKWTVE